MNSLMNASDVQTMTLKEIAEVLNMTRYDNIVTSAQKLHEAGVINLLPCSAGTKINQSLNRLDSITLVAQNKPEFTKALVIRWDELETTQAAPIQPSIETQFDRASKLAKLCMDTLNLPQSGQLKLMADLGKQFGVPTQFLPSYGIDAPPQAVITSGSSKPTFSLTTGLKGYPMSAKTANQILIAHGILEERSRPSTTKGTKTFKAFTEAGLKYGKNVTSPSNPREVQPHFYADMFPIILMLLGL